MPFLKLLIIISIPIMFLGSTRPTKNLSCQEIVTSMLDSLKNVKTQRCDLKSTERVNGHYAYAGSHIKINTNPKKIYFYSILKGNEVLWVQGANKGNAVVHSPSFPLFSLDLDPFGSIMRKDQHHTIFDLGFQNVGKIIANTIMHAPKAFDKHFAYAGTVTWNNIECYQLLINFPEYKYIQHAASKGETVNSIAKKFNTSDFKIRYKNELSSYFGEIKEGKKLLVPTPYASKVIIFVDKKSFMPINIKIYDEDGLFEAYEFYNVVINAPFAPDEFSKSFKGYKF